MNRNNHSPVLLTLAWLLLGCFMAFLAVIHQVPWELATLLGAFYAAVGWHYSREGKSP